MGHINTNNIHTFIDLLASMLITVQSISIQLTSLEYSTTWRKRLQELNIGNATQPKARIYFQIFIIHFVFILKAGWNLCTWTTIVEWKVNNCYLFRIVRDYFTTISIAMMVYINFIIKHRFHCLYQSLNTLYLNTFYPQV